jgi:hypothetical protein
LQRFEDVVDRLLGRRPADSCSDCASVLQAMNSQPIRLERIMLLTAFPPAPPTPMTVMRGLSSCSSFGMLKLIIMPSTLRAAAFPFRPGAGSPVRLPRNRTDIRAIRWPSRLARPQHYAICRDRGTGALRKNRTAS